MTFAKPTQSKKLSVCSKTGEMNFTPINFITQYRHLKLAVSTQTMLLRKVPGKLAYLVDLGSGRPGCLPVLAPPLNAHMMNERKPAQVTQWPCFVMKHAVLSFPSIRR